jgi:hypothetical protein
VTGLKLLLISALALSGGLIMPTSVFAQGTPKVQAAPPIVVESEILEEPDPTGLVVIELFSSQACMFCPKADAYLNTLAAKQNVIALSCHVDYFDIPGTSLAKPFCTERQNMYAKLLRTGPVYTPQMIFNGEYDAIGYKKEAVTKMIRKAARVRIPEIKISDMGNGRYLLSMPDVTTSRYDIWVGITEKPLERSIIIGKNKGQSVLYQNIISDLQSAMEWSGEARNFDLSAPLTPSKSAISIWAQDKNSGQIVAAGQLRNEP